MSFSLPPKDSTLSAEPAIEDISQATRELLFSRYRIATFSVGAVVVFLLFIVATLIENPQVWLLPIVIAGGYYAWIMAKVTEEFMRQFARVHRYEYVGDESEGALHTGILFSQGHNPLVSHRVNGVFEDFPLNLFHYQYTIGYGRHKTNHPFTVFELNVGVSLPRLFLAEKHSFGKEFFSGRTVFPDLAQKIPKTREVKLEGNFSDSFLLMVEEEFEIEALQIFTPDFMELLLTEYREFNIECVGTMIYVYESGTVGKKVDLDKMHDLARYLISALKKSGRGIGTSVSALQEVMSGKNHS